jgi:hypothetical protein
MNNVIEVVALSRSHSELASAVAVRCAHVCATLLFKVEPQCFHLMVSARMSSPQYGHRLVASMRPPRSRRIADRPARAAPMLAIGGNQCEEWRRRITPTEGGYAIIRLSHREGQAYFASRIQSPQAPAV